jgi:hypothetical protein
MWNIDSLYKFIFKVLTVISMHKIKLRLRFNAECSRVLIHTKWRSNLDQKNIKPIACDHRRVYWVLNVTKTLCGFEFKGTYLTKSKKEN